MLNKRNILLIIVVFILVPIPLLHLTVLTDLDTNVYTNVKADDVPDVDLSELPQIDYYSEFNEWENPKIEMLIFVPPNKPDFVDAVKPLAAWKNEKGVKTVILNNSNNAEEIRDLIKDYYNSDDIRWVLLCGDTDLIPIKYLYLPDTTEGIGTENYKPTDFYYADLTSNWDNLNVVDWTAEVYVGRFPANDVNELKIMVNNTLKYETDPEVGGWMHQMLLAGAISDDKNDEPPDGEDESRLTTYILQQYTKLEMNYTHLHDSTYYIPPEPNYDLNGTSFIDRFNEGYSTVMFAGHGSNPPNNYFTDENSNPIFYSDNEAKNALNFNKTSLVYADACTTSAYDIDTYDSDTIGENLMKINQAGAIAFIGGLRKTWYYTDDTNLEKLNRGNAKLFWEEFFQEKKFQPGRALYDSKVAYINSDYYKNRVAPSLKIYEYKNLITYCLLGDPEVDIYTDIPSEASNPFIGSIYEGQLVTNTVRNVNGKAVPYARVYIRSEDGKYNHTTYADKYGRLNFRHYPKEGITYNITITGHNLIKSDFNFTTIPDILSPEIHDEDCDPENPTVSDNLCFSAETYDLQSGIESVFLLQSEDDDDFDDDYIYYKMYNSLQDEEDNIYEQSIDKLDPGEHTFLIVARDWANNYHIYDDKSLEILIPPPMTDYIFIALSILVVGIVGISVFITYKGFKDYKRTILRFERES